MEIKLNNNIQISFKKYSCSHKNADFLKKILLFDRKLYFSNQNCIRTLAILEPGWPVGSREPKTSVFSLKLYQKKNKSRLLFIDFIMSM